MNSLEALLALNQLPKIGPVRVRRMLEHFQSACPSTRMVDDGMSKDASGWCHHLSAQYAMERQARRNTKNSPN